MPQILDWLERLGQRAGMGHELAELTAQLVVVAAILVAGWLANFVVRRFLLGWAKLFIGRTENKWDDALIERHVLDRLAHVAPAVVIYVLLPLAFPTSNRLQDVIRQCAVAYMVLIGSLVVDAMLSAISDVYHNLEIAKTRPIKTYLQVVRILLYMVTGILVLSVLLNRSPWGFLTGLGAMTAVLLLVFKDTILGFVASVQLISQDLVRVGDWIEMPKYGADGDVIDVSIHTIKVRNWDKTITTIPTYALISDSFRNWRGMKESGGRRIKRSIRVDMNSVRFCDEEMLQRFEKIGLLTEYIQTKRRELEQHNQERNIDPTVTVNRRRLTNLGTFRMYLTNYLRKNPKIHPDLTFLVRYLEPDGEGIPLEIYVFSADQVWANYEALQADIFDHVLAALSEFDLRVFQNPSGADMRAVAHAIAAAGLPPTGSAPEPIRTPRTTKSFAAIE